MALVRDFFDLDNGFTRKILENLVSLGALPYDNDPYHRDEWRTNPFITIAQNKSIWDKYVYLHPGQLTLTSYFRSLAICQFYVMKNTNGPEGDGAMQMLRKHWYAWGKAGLQSASRHLGVGLMPNGEPDSEKLYDLMSRTFGDWNRDGSLEYRQIWILDNTTKMLLFEETLPPPFDGIIICCEKDAAFNGVALSAKAMGACAVYSGGGKSSRAGIEKLYYSRLKKVIERGSTIYVLVISDWDTDGEAVIAPTFVEQLSTYIPSYQLEWTRVGITPEQIQQLGYDWQDKWYDLKWDVNGMLNYYTWSSEKAVLSYECQNCYSQVVEVGAVCPECRREQLPLVDSNNGHSKEEKDAMKADFKRFFTENTPHGFELDALTRVEYCSLLVEGLAKLVNIEDICSALSEIAMPTEDDVLWDIQKELLNKNESYEKIGKHLDKLQTWFNAKTEELNNIRYGIERDAQSLARELIREYLEDERVLEDDPGCFADGMSDHMRNSRFNEGTCTWCFGPTTECRNPEDHQRHYWTKDANEDEVLNGVKLFQPYSRRNRAEKLSEIVLEEEEEAMEEFGEKEYEYEEVDLGQDDDEN